MRPIPQQTVHEPSLSRHVHRVITRGTEPDAVSKHPSNHPDPESALKPHAHHAGPSINHPLIRYVSNFSNIDCPCQPSGHLRPDDAFSLKGNMGTLHAEVAAFLEDAAARNTQEQNRFATVEKRYGRIEMGSQLSVETSSISCRTRLPSPK